MSPFTAIPLGSSDTETAFVRFLLGRAEALFAAAALLGGQPAVHRTARLLEELVDTPHLARRLRQELVELHQLLALGRIDDPESFEARCFSRIDPTLLLVEEICELADALRHHLIALAEPEIDEPGQKQIVVSV